MDNEALTGPEEERGHPVGVAEGYLISAITSTSLV